MRDHKRSPEIETERLLLRRFRDADREPFAAMCADPRVMEFLTPLPTRVESDAYIDRATAHYDRHDFGVMAIEDRATGTFAGLAGLKRVEFEAHFTPSVEIAWRLAYHQWGKGYASEAAMASLDHGFGALGLDEVVSFAFIRNERSQRVMARVGMRREPDGDFDIPTLPDGHLLRRHVLYRIHAAGHLAHLGRATNKETL